MEDGGGVEVVVAWEKFLDVAVNRSRNSRNRGVGDVAKRVFFSFSPLEREMLLEESMFAPGSAHACERARAD